MSASELELRDAIGQLTERIDALNVAMNEVAATIAEAVREAPRLPTMTAMGVPADPEPR